MTPPAAPPPGEPSPFEDLAAAIHDTTNALTVILGWIERARDACNGQPGALEALERAADHARSARSVMRRAIGATPPADAPERADALARRTLEDLKVEAARSGVALVPSIDARWGILGVPSPQVAWQVLTNLLLNALAHSSAGGHVWLEVIGVGQQLIFRVHDEGPGVPPEMRPTLFTAGVSGRVGGAGIGLRHAHALARAAGGSLDLIPTERGACFELRWPIAPEPRARPSQAPPPMVSQRALDGARVLLLEDDAAVVELLELALAARGAELTTVRTAEALDEALDNGAFDAMLVDLSPLGEGVHAACEKARDRNPDLSVIVISGSVTIQPRADVVWVRKPFEPAELVAAIVRDRTAIAAARARGR